MLAHGSSAGKLYAELHSNWEENTNVNTDDLKLRSEKWLRTYCEHEADVPSYDAMMDAVTHSDGEYLYFSDDASGPIHPDFWYHYEVLTGVHFDSPPQFISCAC